MKFLLFFLLSLTFTVSISAQNLSMTEEELKMKLDSILVEGKLLYAYERAAWVSTDLLATDPDLRAQAQSYLTYNSGSALTTIIVGDNMEKCLAEFSFVTSYDKPDIATIKKRDLTELEVKLLGVRDNVINQLGNEEYNLGIPEGYSLNLVLIPFEEKFKTYILTGTSQSDIIPFGNDYLFITDSDGQIESWKKFHTGLIPSNTSHEGNKVVKMTHSHVKDNPLISATDICTFMLYAPLYDIDAFSVYSGGVYMEFNLEKQEITVKTDLY